MQKDASFDLINEMWHGLPLLRRVTLMAHKSPATLLNLYMPLRIEANKDVADNLSDVQQKFQPADGFYFGVVFADRTVVNIFRQSKVILSPAGMYKVRNL